jgi:hypothetical protein
MKTRWIEVNDLMQIGYVYQLTQPIGCNFPPDFHPQLTPQQMLSLGIFGGKYMTDCISEFPSEWFERAKLCHERHDAKLNYFKVNASQPLSIWREKGWIHPDDPRGWFQWYCRYFLGRRSDDDNRQIHRWKAMKRHQVQVSKHCASEDTTCRPKQRQALLHWAYDSIRC